MKPSLVPSVQGRLSHSLALVALLATATAANAAPSCYRYGGAWENNIPNKLYLYFPTAADATFPNYPQSCGTPVSPAQPFDATAFNPAFSTPVLRDRVFDVVTDDYCELNVQVRQSTTNPDSFGSPDPRRNIVAVGSDPGGCFGVAQNYAGQIDLNDTHPIDHARVWGGSYPLGCDAAHVSELTGVNSTIDRWANAIGSTSAHEAGHNYGLQHGDDSFIHAGEDNRFNHIMPSATLPGEVPPVPTCDFRAGVKRHFSDTTFSILATNIGLVSQTMGNWDFVNPNTVPASKLHMRVLSTAASLTLTYWWNGLWSPWSAPSVSGSLGTTTFQGTLYNIFQVEWSVGKPWEGRNQPGTAQTPAVVPPGITFHIGAEFNGSHYYDPDPFIIQGVTLLDGSNNVLPLQPRMAGYDNGTLDMASGDFILRFFNFDQPLLLQDLTVYELPRKLSLDAMQFGMEMKTWDGVPLTPWRVSKLGDFQLSKDGMRLPLRNLYKDGHNVFVVHGKQPGESGDASNGAADENPDVPGSISVDLFPATTVYITARVVDPNTRYKDPKTGEEKAAESLMFYQFAGKRERRPLSGQVGGLLRLKPVCVNLNTRQSLGAEVNESHWDCTNAGFAASLGNSVNVILKGVFNGERNENGDAPLTGNVEGMKLQKVVCTNLSSRASATARLDGGGNFDCAVDGFDVKAGDSINVVAKGVIN
jgi:hypothetical protein